MCVCPQACGGVYLGVCAWVCMCARVCGGSVCPGVCVHEDMFLCVYVPMGGGIQRVYLDVCA